MRLRLIAMAVFAIAGHQAASAGYRVVGETQETPYSMPSAEPVAVPVPVPTSVVRPVPIATPVPVPVASPYPPVTDSLPARVQALEAEIRELRARLRAASYQSGMVRPAPSTAPEQAAVDFGQGSVALPPSAAQRAQLIERARSAHAIEIVGYTDSTGSLAINKKIALSRAQLVKDLLVRNGVDPSIITVSEAAGIYHASNTTPQGRAANRRTLVTVL